MSVTHRLRSLIASPDQVEDLITLIGDRPKDLEALLATDDMRETFGGMAELLDHPLGGPDHGFVDDFVRERIEPCLRIGSDGIVIRVNVSARAALGAEAGQHIDDLEIWPLNHTPLGQQVASLLDSAAGRSRFYASRAHTKELAQPVPYLLIALSGSADDTDCEVLLLIGKEAEFAGQHAQMYRERDLSPSEVEVTEEFLRGRTLSEIAEARGRSLATVRKQFYSICEKFGVTSQAELLRAIYQDAWLVSDMRTMIDKSERPDRIEARILRPGGRTVEVIIGGDPLGYPVILLPSPSLMTWPAATERLFRNNGLQCITVVAPGFGKTSPSPPNERRAVTGRADLLAVMDQLELPRAMIFTSNFGLRSSLEYATAAPDRFVEVIVQSPSLPRVQLVNNRKQSKIKILNSLQKILSSAYGLSDLAVLAAARSFQAMSPDAAVRLIHRGSPEAVNSFLSPENYPDVHRAVRSLFEQGISPGASGFKSSQGDWASLINACEVPVTLIGGVASDLHDVSDIADYAARYPDKIAFLDVSQHGFATPYDMAGFLISLIRTKAKL